MTFPTVLRSPDLVMLAWEGGESRLVPHEGVAYSGDIVVTARPEGGALPIRIGAGATALRFVRLRWQAAAPLEGPVHILGDAWERLYGDAGWQGMAPCRMMPWYFLVNDGAAVAGYGVQVRPGALCAWQVDAGGITLCLDVRSGGAGVVLGGRTLAAATVVQGYYPGQSAYAAARALCARMCSDGLRPPQPVYGFNNWYYAYGRSSAAEILADADTLARLTADLPARPCLVIDDGWQPHHRDDYNGGPWDGGNAAFPDMPGLAADIAARGLLPGLWFRPLLDDVSPLPAEWRLPTGALDPSHPGVLARVQEDVDRLCRWGFRLLKHDFSTFDFFGRWGFEMRPFAAADGWRPYDCSRTSAEILTGFYRTILQTAQPYGTLVLGCNTMGHLAAGLEHLQRIGDDTSGLSWERTLCMGVNALAMRMPQHRIFFDCDADCLGITGAIPWAYGRQWGDLLGRSGTPLFVSLKPGVLTPAEERELAGFLAMSARQDEAAEPLDWQQTTHPQHWRCGTQEVCYDWYQDIPLPAPGQAENGYGGGRPQDQGPAQAEDMHH